MIPPSFGKIKSLMQISHSQDLVKGTLFLVTFLPIVLENSTEVVLGALDICQHTEAIHHST